MDYCEKIKEEWEEKYFFKGSFGTKFEIFSVGYFFNMIGKNLLVHDDWKCYFVDFFDICGCGIFMWYWKIKKYFYAYKYFVKFSLRKIEESYLFLKTHNIFECFCIFFTKICNLLISDAYKATNLKHYLNSLK